LNVRHFSSDAEVFAAAETWLDGQLSELFLRGLQKLEQRAKKCIQLRGEYVELIPSLFAVACFLPGRAKDLSAPLVPAPGCEIPSTFHQHRRSDKITNRPIT